MTIAAACDVIVPFFGRSDLVTQCLRGLAQAPPRGCTYLVDDGSSHRERRRVARACDETGLRCEVVTMPRRVGFVGAVNAAWELCTAPFVMLLNSDAFVRPGAARLLCDALARGAHLAAVGPTSTSRRDLTQYRRTPHDAGVGAAVVSPTPFLTAMCLVLRREAVGNRPFDPIYAPGYFEDLDLCCRLRDDGWELGIVEGARVHHVGGATTGGDASRRATMARNYATYSARWDTLPEHASLEELLRAVDAPHDGDVS